VSVHLIVPARGEYQSDVVRLPAKEPARVHRVAEATRTSARDRLLGIMGILVSGFIVALTIYSVFRYLL
jgi:hypothetical protein